MNRCPDARFGDLSPARPHFWATHHLVIQHAALDRVQGAALPHGLKRVPGGGLRVASGVRVREQGRKRWRAERRGFTNHIETTSRHLGLR